MLFPWARPASTSLPNAAVPAAGDSIGFSCTGAELLQDLLAYWERASTVLFERILQLPGRNRMDKYLAMTDLWLDEQDYPKWDGAVRDWARTSEQVRKVVQVVDQRRIAVLEQIFKEIGYEGKRCPSTSSDISKFCESGISSAVTSQGTIGANISQPLSLSHLPPRQSDQVSEVPPHSDAGQWTRPSTYSTPG